MKMTIVKCIHISYKPLTTPLLAQSYIQTCHLTYLLRLGVCVHCCFDGDELVEQRLILIEVIKEPVRPLYSHTRCTDSCRYILNTISVNVIYWLLSRYTWINLWRANASSLGRSKVRNVSRKSRTKFGSSRVRVSSTIALINLDGDPLTTTVLVPPCRD